MSNLDVFDLFNRDYSREQLETMSLRDWLLAARDDKMLYASPAERMISAIGEQELIDTAQDPRLSRIFFKRTIKRYRAFEGFYGMEDTIERIVVEEAASFRLDTMGLSVTTEGVSALETKTEGWISGLQLAALSMQGRQDIESFVRTFSGRHRYILDYLVEEVLSRQPVQIQQFLLQTSILEELSAPLCEAVTGVDSGAQATLEYLERANIFTIPLDDDRHWYRYHHLFADLLGVRLGQSNPDLVPALHQRAAAWLDGHGFTIPAVQHALTAKDFTLAAEIMEAHSAER